MAEVRKGWVGWGVTSRVPVPGSLPLQLFLLSQVPRPTHKSIREPALTTITTLPTQLAFAPTTSSPRIMAILTMWWEILYSEKKKLMILILQPMGRQYVFLAGLLEGICI